MMCRNISAANTNEEEKEEETANAESWACNACTYENSDMNTQKCEICSTVRQPPPPPPPPPPVWNEYYDRETQRLYYHHNTTGVTPWTRPIDNSFTPAPIWKCTKCTFDNDPTHAICEMCHTPKLGVFNQ